MTNEFTDKQYCDIMGVCHDPQEKCIISKSSDMYIYWYFKSQNEVSHKCLVVL